MQRVQTRAVDYSIAQSSTQCASDSQDCGKHRFSCYHLAGTFLDHKSSCALGPRMLDEKMKGYQCAGGWFAFIKWKFETLAVVWSLL